MPHTQQSTSRNANYAFAPAPRKHLAKRQIYPNSCGAAALLCAAKELGISQMPMYSGSMSEQLGVDTLELDNRCESDLYKITSGSTTHRKGETNLNKAGYSMPDNIVIAGRLLGLTMRVEKDQRLLAKALNSLYPKIEAELKAMGCPVVPPLHPLRLNELRLEALAVSVIGVPIGLHWVVLRPDGSYMDPGTGANYTDFSALNSGAKQAVSRTVGYYRSGISIVATRD